VNQFTVSQAVNSVGDANAQWNTIAFSRPNTDESVQNLFTRFLWDPRYFPRGDLPDGVLLFSAALLHGLTAMSATGH